MTWFRVDDNLAFHRKVVSAGNAAMGLWVRAGSWCAQHLTDGFIPDEMITILGTPAQRAKLISAGLWVEAVGGCRFHEWNENGRQPTGQSVRERRSAAAERQAKWRAQKSATSQVDEPGNGVTSASVTPPVTPGVTPTPTRPDPTHKEVTTSSTPAASRDDVEQLCARLRDRMTANGFKASTITEDWRRQARLLLDKDDRDLTQALRLIDWATADEFWHPNIKSMGKFRAQYDTLLARARQEQQRRSRPGPRTADDKIAALQAMKTGGSNVYALPRGAAQ